MRFLTCFTVFSLTLASVTAATAQEREGVWVSYTIEINDPVVEGAYLIAKVENGQVIRQSYPLKKIQRFIAQDCAAGKIGKLQMGKQKQQRKRGETRILQYFQTTCQGGIRADVRGTKYGTNAIVVRNAQGQDEATYQFGRSGDILYSKSIK